MTRRILIQCQSLTYFYNGLAAAYTKYPDEDIQADILVTNNAVLASGFAEKIKHSKYAGNIFIYDYKKLSKISKRIKKSRKTALNIFIFEHLLKPLICRGMKQMLDNQEYSDVVYSHETQSNIIKYLQFTYPEAHFIMTGDGSGLLTGADSKLTAPFSDPFEYKFFEEMKPDEIISPAPFMEDNSLDIKGVPVTGTDENIFLKLICEDENIQREINEFTDNILSKYSNVKTKTMLLLSQLNDAKYGMNENDQINIYADIIDKYCDTDSLVILKLHPVSDGSIVSEIQNRIHKKCIIEFIPQTMKQYPVEIYYKLIKNLDFIISFISSSGISLSRFYGINTITAEDVIIKYPMKKAIMPVLQVYSKIIEGFKNWDKKSLLYNENISELLLKFYKPKAPEKKQKKLSFLQKIFSVVNIYSDYGMKKQITVLGIRVKV